VGVFALNSGPVLVGPILDWLGPKLTLLLGVALNISGLALVGCAPGARGALPAGAVLMGLGGITFHLAQFHVSNLFPLRRGLISSLMVAGFTGCGIVFYFLDLIYNAALRAHPATLMPAVAFRTVSLGYAGVCALWVPLALWLAPWHALRVGQAFVHKGRGRFGVVERRAVEARATAEAAADARRATADVSSSPTGVAMATLESDRAGGPPAGLAPVVTGRGPPGGDGLATLEAAASPSPGPSPGPLSGEAALAYMGAAGRGGGGGAGGGNAALLAPDGGPGAASPTASASGAPLTGPTASSFLYPGADSADPRWADLDSPTAADRAGSGLGAGTAGGPGGATQPAAGVTYGPLTFEARRFVDLREKSFWAQFTSPESTGMGAFYTLNVLAIQFYLGTARLQLGSKGDAGTGYAFTKFATILPAFGFVAIPAAAWLLDTKGYGATLGAINLLGVLASLCQALPGLKVQALTLALWAIGRFLLYTSYFAIFGALFGFRNFGRMVAIDNTVNGLVGLLQVRRRAGGEMEEVERERAALASLSPFLLSILTHSAPAHHLGPARPGRQLHGHQPAAGHLPSAPVRLLLGHASVGDDRPRPHPPGRGGGPADQPAGPPPGPGGPLPGHAGEAAGWGGGWGDRLIRDGGRGREGGGD